MHHPYYNLAPISTTHRNDFGELTLCFQAHEKFYNIRDKMSLKEEIKVSVMEDTQDNILFP
jgi:hypothetical protein